ncbi:hypothetical protein M2419_005369 [Sphingobacterium sp. BIGb0116]|nr:hypothetical protein [Sphingobacterium sp. BIGb0116]
MKYPNPTSASNTTALDILNVTKYKENISSSSMRMNSF